jgi:phosphoglycerate kinase
MLAVDIGSKTVVEYGKILNKAKVVVWNGPLGYFENDKIIDNSVKLAQKLAKIKAKTVIGGGETVAMASRLGLRNKFDFVSTGGGAMIAFLEGQKMPVLEKLKYKI